MHKLGFMNQSRRELLAESAGMTNNKKLSLLEDKRNKEIGPTQQLAHQPAQGSSGGQVLGKITPAKRRIVRDPKTGVVLEDKITYPGGLVKDMHKKI